MSESAIPYLGKNGRNWPVVRGCSRCDESVLDVPLKRRKPTVYGVAFGGDLFHSKVPLRTIYTVLQTARYTKRHIYLILTKRPKRMACLADQVVVNNVWLGVSAWDQASLDAAAPHLARLAAAGWHTWLSIEPMLGPVTLPRWIEHNHAETIGAVIVGGLSGPRWRKHPLDLDALRSVIDQCRNAGVPVYVKQDAGPRAGQQGNIPDDLWARKDVPWRTKHA